MAFEGKEEQKWAHYIPKRGHAPYERLVFYKIFITEKGEKIYPAPIFLENAEKL
jgi:hypothetical protein